MKTKILIICISTLLAISAKSQITLEHSYPSPVSNMIYIYTVNLANSGYKYAVEDYSNKQVRLYNLDHSLWKTIQLTMPAGATWGNVYNISETLFNSDGEVEVGYNYHITSPAEYEFVVISETGSIITTIHDCSGVSIKSTGANGWKIIAQIGTGALGTFDIYSLPGTMPSAVHEDKDIQDNSGYAFPNPAKNNITIPYQLPAGCSKGELVIYNIMGIEMMRYQIDNTFNNLIINVSSLNSGTYIYKTFANNSISDSKVFIVN